MPRLLIRDAHEWINEILTVPIYYLAKPQLRERAQNNQRGKKTLLSLTLVRLCELMRGVQNRWEPKGKLEIPLPVTLIRLFTRIGKRLCLQFLALTGWTCSRGSASSGVGRFCGPLSPGSNVKTFSGGEFGWGGTSVKR